MNEILLLKRMDSSEGPSCGQHTSRAKALPTALSPGCEESWGPIIQLAGGCPRRAAARLEQCGLRFKFGRIGLEFANDALVIKGCGKLPAPCGSVPERRRLPSRDITDR